MINPEKWKEVKAAFSGAVDLGTIERADFLASIGDSEVENEVKRMIEADGVDLFAQSPVHETPGNSSIPERIGGYRIIREVGRGGMGTVFLAQRDDGEFNQLVALKIIKRGMDSDEILKRFRNERQILADLQHPLIAKLFDGGVTSDGLPYYVMEFVDGRPVDAYCRENELSVVQRLELFRKICSAVSYAHQHLIVHRDLKPSNILVAENGEPKLVDFGIAKILSSDGGRETATQLGMMTPAYASPEQIRGEKITTSADVYSLGVILFEILTGARPYETDGKGYAEIIELVCDSQLSRPSAIAARSTHGRDSVPNSSPINGGQTRELKGDLDNITLKSLMREPEKRYSSVQELSEDIRYHLVGLPISARADSVLYRFGKFIKRNKISAISATVVFLSLCTGITIAIWQAQRAEHQRVLAEKRFADVRQLANNVVFKYHDAIANLPGATAAREMLVKDALQYLDALAQEAGSDDQLQKELALAYLKLGDVQGKMYQANIGDSEGAVRSYEKSVALLEQVVRNKPDDVQARESLIKAYDSLAFLILRTGSADTSARDVVQKAFAQFDELQRIDSGNSTRELQLVDLYIRLGDTDVGDGQNGADYTIRLNHHLKALPLIERFMKTELHDFEKVRAAARVYQRIGTDYVVLGNQAGEVLGDAAAKEMYVKALEYNEKFSATVERMTELKPDDVATKRYQAGAYFSLSEALAENGRFEEAIRLSQNFSGLIEQTLLADPQDREAELDRSLAAGLFAKIYLRRKDYKLYFEYAEKTISIDNGIVENDPRNSEALTRIDKRSVELVKVCEIIGDKRKAETYRRYSKDAAALLDAVIKKN